ncbi:MAG TPA: DUF4386 family protein [Vicinamibacterales bacterium]
MSRTTAARVAGFTFLFYIAVGISSLAGAFRGQAAGLATYAQNASAVILALTLFVVTRVEQPVIAALGMVFRLAEGTLGLVLAKIAITVPHRTLVAATLFAIGSTFFCWLLLRGRMVPRGLAWTGVIASVILVVGLPLQLGGLLGAPLTMLMWMPMLAFEVPGGLWLLIKAVPPSRSLARPITSSTPTARINV